ncbi:unnamed protein product [Absidia cylindrospora]
MIDQATKTSGYSSINTPGPTFDEESSSSTKLLPQPSTMEFDFTLTTTKIMSSLTQSLHPSFISNSNRLTSFVTGSFFTQKPSSSKKTTSSTTKKSKSSKSTNIPTTTSTPSSSTSAESSFSKSDGPTTEYSINSMSISSIFSEASSSPSTSISGAILFFIFRRKKEDHSKIINPPSPSAFENIIANTDEKWTTCTTPHYEQDRYGGATSWTRSNDFQYQRTAPTSPQHQLTSPRMNEEHHHYHYHYDEEGCSPVATQRNSSHRYYYHHYDGHSPLEDPHNTPTLCHYSQKPDDVVVQSDTPPYSNQIIHW